MRILGISCFNQDAAVALVENGRLTHAVEQESFSRVRHDPSFPTEAIRWALEASGSEVRDIEAVAFYEKPYLKMDRIIKSHFEVWPRSRGPFRKTLLEWSSGRLNFRGLLKKELGYFGPVYFCEHHESHAASAYYSSGFRDAAVVMVDGPGEWATTKIFEGRNGKLHPLLELHYPHSLGLFYGGMAQFLGFKSDDAEGVRELARGGEPRFVDLLKSEIIRIEENGSFRLNMDYFSFQVGPSLIRKDLWTKLFQFSVRRPEEEIRPLHCDLAKSAYVLLEEVLNSIVDFSIDRTGLGNVCLTGGTALDFVGRSPTFKNQKLQDLFVFPSTGDAGGAIGAAYWLSHELMKCELPGKSVNSLNLGPEYSRAFIREYLIRNNIPYQEWNDEAELVKKAARLLYEGKTVGWFHGKMEFGSQASGFRSVLSVDSTGKKRQDSERLKEKVSKEDNPRFHHLLEEFRKLSGDSVLLNSSLSLAGEVMACTPQDAFGVFVRGGLDHLFLENCHIAREELPCFER